MYKKVAMPGVIAALMSLFLSVSVPAGDFGGEVLSNSDIVNLSRANVAASTIIAKINSTPNMFDVSTSSIIALQAGGVSNDVVNAMVAASSRSGLSALDVARFRTELANVASGVNDTKLGALNWLQANREQTLPALRQTLADQRPEMRMAALMALGYMRDNDSLPAMRNLITDSSPMVRQATAQVLADLNDAQSINAAEVALTRPLNNLDGYALLVGHARLTRAAGILGQVLSTSAEAPTRAAAAWAIGNIGRPAVDGRAAVEKALSSDPDPTVRREAAIAVAKFHDERSAQLLEDACRKDYEVRKTTLAVLAEYPESVGFLVEVMNLAPDQIAADEMETARNSLVRLTSQDFGTDGARWSEWFAANRSRYPSAQGGASVMTMSPGLRTAAPDPYRQEAPAKSSVDLEAWSIVADSSNIPMAPQADSGSRAPLLPGLPSYDGGAASRPRSAPALPFAPSPQDFEAAAPDLSRLVAGGGPAVPSSVPDTDLTSSPSAPGGSSGSLFQTWRADEDSGGSGPSSAPSLGGSLPSSGMAPSTASSPTPPAGMQDTGGIPSWMDAGPSSGQDLSQSESTLYGPAADDGFGGTLRPDASSSMPTAPVVTPQPSVGDTAPQSLSGLSLTLPGMESPVEISGGDEYEPSPSASSLFGSPSSFDSVDGDSAAFGEPADGNMFEQYVSEPGDDSGASLSPYAADGSDSASGMDGNDWDSGLFSSPSDGDIVTGTPMETAVQDTDPFAAPGFEGVDSGASSSPGEYDDIFTYQDVTGAESPAPSSDPFGSLRPPSDGIEQADVYSDGNVFLDSGTEYQTPVEAYDDAFGAPVESVDSGIPGTEDQWSTGSTDSPFVSEYEPVGTEGLDGDVFDAPQAVDAQPMQEAEPFVVESQPVQEAEPFVVPAEPSGGMVIDSSPAAAGTPLADPFTNPAAPMPPVRQEGTVTAPKGKDMPPMLGEGMFDRKR